MTWIDYEFFTDKWLERAQRREESVDDGDRFISLWIAFNGWMKGKFGEDKRDEELIDKVKKLEDIRNLFRVLKERNPRFSKDLVKLSNYTVADMRHIDNTNRIRQYDGTFESLIDIIYQIRCNLFHGRKGEDEKDLKLISLSYAILLPLFKEYLKKYGYS